MKTELRNRAIELRLSKQLGYASIAKLLPVSKSTLSAWLKDFPLSEGRIRELRQQTLKNNEAKIETFRNTMREKREEKFRISYTKHRKSFSKILKETRFVARLMLYLAEGSKKDDYHIVLANTDPSVISFHMKWGTEFLGIPQKAYKVQLHLYEDMDVFEEVKFWKSSLKISEAQFYKHQIRKLKKSSFSYRESFRHGTCLVSYTNSNKKRELMSAIKAFCDSF